MNEIAKLVKAYDRLWKDIEAMKQDISSILTEEDEAMECLVDGDDDVLKHNVIYQLLYKDKMIIYIIADLSVDFPFLQIFKINILNIKGSITKEYMKEEGYKDRDPNEFFEDGKIEKTGKDFTLVKTKNIECVASPKIDILSINSTDIVNSEIKNLLSCMINNDYKGFSSKKLMIIESE
jgi:hypothetical protein